MKIPSRPEDERSRDLEERWEDVLHGRASPEEVDNVLREIAESGMQEKFEAQAEVYAAIRGHSARPEISTTLHAHLRQLVAAKKTKGFEWRKVRWAAAGAVAAALVMALGLSFVRVQPVPEKDLFAIIAKEARAEYQRALLDPRPVQSGSPVLNRVQRWFERRVEFRPRVYFEGNRETVLEGGRVGFIAGVKVPGFLYRWEGKPIILIILPAGGNPKWSHLPRRKWVAVTDDGPTASVWRRGDFIYAIVGNAPVKKLREISRSITPRDKKF